MLYKYNYKEYNLIKEINLVKVNIYYLININI